ncbi:MAG: hypothetical protein C4562_00530 [Actinobacteria bacterium]|nr:MAG: hypothetical protein C4562_00530 [Actinomycetota bacterium]
MFDKDVSRLIHFSSFFGFPQISLEPIRLRQDSALAGDLIQGAINKLKTTNSNVTNKPSFFAGSVDFMVKNIAGKKTFYVLETNGGSSRGFSALPFKHWRQAYDGYTETLNHIHKKNPLVVLASPNSDLLFYEKVLLAEHFLTKLKTFSEKAKTVAINNLEPKDLKGKPLVVIGDYQSIIPRVKLSNNYLTLDGKQIDVLIGDGAARRCAAVVKHLHKKSLKTIIVNDVFFITDDKSLTYQAVEMANKTLGLHGVEPIIFKRAFSYEDLYFKCRQALEELPEILIKPHGGSGGSGIDIITDKRQIKKKIESSISHYHNKFGQNRNPYPYTICQRVEATPITWNDSLRHFDIRVYIGRKGKAIVPTGALMRIALEPFNGYFTKKSFVVNLSGYEGVDTDRGLGVSKASLALLGLSKNDFAKMFAVACSLCAYISNNYQEIMLASKKDA